MISRKTNQEMLAMLLRKNEPPTPHEIRMILVELVNRQVDADVVIEIDVPPPGCDEYGSLD